MNFEIRAEAKNALNHPNFGLPENQFNLTTSGLITTVANTGRGGPRVFQAALKYEF